MGRHWQLCTHAAIHRINPELLSGAKLQPRVRHRCFACAFGIAYRANLKPVTHLAAAFVKEKDAVAEIIPRWEWRSFGRRFGDAEWRLAKITPSGVQDSDEIYLLSGAGGNVKIRDALDGHQGEAGGQRRGPRTVDAGHEGRLSASCK